MGELSKQLAHHFPTAGRYAHIAFCAMRRLHSTRGPTRRRVISGPEYCGRMTGRFDYRPDSKTLGL
jgi:hypothetical protein